MARPLLRLVLVLAPLLQLHVGYAEEMRMYLTRQIVSQERRLRSMALRILHAVQAPRDISTAVVQLLPLLANASANATAAVCGCGCGCGWLLLAW